jgi:predicted ABC-type transport system involved in lysophospholipase L1 biosynthesis ATPase subunit
MVTLNLDKIFNPKSIAIIGVSGAGKSTLLHIVGALDYPTQGKVIFEETDFSALDPLRLARIRNNRIGFVFQFHHLIFRSYSSENSRVEHSFLQNCPAHARPSCARDFRNPCSNPLSINGNESMHFPIQANIFQDVSSVGLECASIVVQMNAPDP